MSAADPGAAAPALQLALERIGLRLSVEARGRLAVLRVHDDDLPLRDAGVRDRIALLAREHGFTHTALELDG